MDGAMANREVMEAAAPRRGTARPRRQLDGKGRHNGDSTTMDEEEPREDTYLGRYAAMQKNNTVAAVLDFTDEEWESLKQIKEDDMMREMANPSEEGNNNNNGAGLGAKNGVNGGDINEEAV